MPLIRDEHQMLVAVQGWLQDQFDANPTDIPDYPEEGAHVDSQLRRNIPDNAAIVGAPSIALSLQNDVRSAWAGANGRERDCVINIETRAADNAGAVEGEANPQAAHIKMARAIREFIANNSDTIPGAYPGLTTIQAQGEDSNTAKSRLFLTYSEI